MMRTAYVLLTASILALLPLSCGSVLPVSPAPIYYRLVYEPAPVPCDRSFAGGGVRVWRFTEASPFDRAEMTVLGPGEEVTFAGTNRWVSTPGRLVADSLIRDLTMGTTFPQVVSGENPAAVPYEITGRVFEFGWVERKGLGKAVLEVEVSLVRRSGTPEVIARRRYEVESAPFAQDSASAFAAAMSEAVGRFSREVRVDFCNAAAEFAQPSSTSASAGDRGGSVPPAETGKGAGSP
jgi:ABC-type uncharacterized transport system auxiliary subunit